MLEIGSSSHSSPDASLGQEISVLLVDHDKEWLSSTANLFQLCSYKVTKVEAGLDALSILSDGMQEFDLVLVDLNLRDLDAFTLLKLIAKMDLLSILMSENEDDAIISKAMKSGAFLLLSKPFSIDVMKQLRQHVMRQRMQRLIKYDVETNVLTDEETNGESGSCDDLKRNVGITINEGGNVGKKRKTKNALAKKGRKGRKSNKDQEGNSVYAKHKFRYGRVKRKACTEWTLELHEKFLDAVNQLGEGRCYPKEILELMNVPGLTRMQVASHLQKCRNDNWRAPVVRKYRQVSSAGDSSGRSQRRDGHRRFGSMPRVDQSEPSVQENICTPEVTSSPASEFTENAARENQQNRRVRSRFGSYPFMRQEREGASFDDNPPTMDNTDSELEAIYNRNESIYIPTMENTTELPSYDQIYSDHSIAVEQKQPNDAFFNLLRNDMDGYVPNLNRVLPGGSVGNQGLSSQPFLYDYSTHLPDQATMTTPDIIGQWSANTTNFFRY